LLGPFVGLRILDDCRRRPVLGDDHRPAAVAHRLDHLGQVGLHVADGLGIDGHGIPRSRIWYRIRVVGQSRGRTPSEPPWLVPCRIRAERPDPTGNEPPGCGISDDPYARVPPWAIGCRAVGALDPGWEE